MYTPPIVKIVHNLFYFFRSKVVPYVYLKDLKSRPERGKTAERGGSELGLPIILIRFRRDFASVPYTTGV